ncbi:MAG TPA: CBS domain-containing protein [Microvirga sp.]|nr:CBS domain-containing protein [Microvirga sp.]
MQLKDIMTRDPVVLPPDTTLKEAAQRMRDLDSGVMPVGEDDQLLGMLTDRDITVRATAEGKDPNGTPVREVMTPEVVYCFEDDDVREAAGRMEEHQIRRLIVLNRDKRLAGIVALGDIAVHAPSDRLAGEITEAVSEPADVER